MKKESNYLNNSFINEVQCTLVSFKGKSYTFDENSFHSIKSKAIPKIAVYSRKLRQWCHAYWQIKTLRKIQSFFRKASYINQRHTIEENSFLSSQAEQQDNFSWKDKTWRCVPYWWYDLFLRHCKERVTWTWMLFATKQSFRWKGLKTARDRNFTVKYVEKKVCLALTTLAPRFRSCSQPA